MSRRRVERCYRLLIRLLPAEERAARGEEFLGLLLELEEDRAWPSPQETAALLALAARLHLRRLAVARLAVALLGAYLIVVGTSTASEMLGAAARPTPGNAFDYADAPIVIFVLTRLSVAVAWICGAYRSALLLVSAMVTLQIYSLCTTYASGFGFSFWLFSIGGYAGLVWLAVICIGVPAALLVAVERRPARPPRWVGLTAIAAAFIAQFVVYTSAGAYVSSRVAGFWHGSATWPLSVVCAATIALHVHRRSRRLLATGIIAGFAGGWLLSLIMPGIYSVTIAVTLCVGEAAGIAAASRGTRAQAAPAAPATDTA